MVTMDEAKNELELNQLKDSIVLLHDEELDRLIDQEYYQ
jgi:hypothetical protein